MYAIIEAVGKQYKVSSGQTVDVDLMDVKEGETVEFDKVLLIADDSKITVGTPVIEGAKVTATAQGLQKGDKIIVLKFKHKDHYTKKTGHRAKFTRLNIKDIMLPGANKN